MKTFEDLKSKYLNKYSQEEINGLIEKYGYEELLAKLYVKAKKNKRVNIIIGVLSIMVAINCTIMGTQIYNNFNFTEPTYNKNDNYEAGYFNDHPYVISIQTDNLTQKELNLIRDAILELDNAMLGMCFDVVENGEKLQDLTILKTKIEGNIALGNLAGEARYFPDNLKGTVFINSATFNKSEEYIKSVIIHEIMHVLGFNHSKDINSIMFPYQLENGLSSKDIENLNTVFPQAEPELEK